MDARHRIRLLSLVILALFAGGLYLYHYVPDDTFITLRYARNLARGDGLVFNEGVRLEGYTNFLWLIMLAAGAKIGLPLLGTARALSGLFSLAVLWLTYSLARDTARRANLAGWDEALAAALPPMLLAASAPFPVWSLSGTEIPLYTALLLFGFKLVRDRGPALSVFAVFALLGLVRPDGLLFYLLAWFLLLRRGAEPDGDARTGGRGEEERDGDGRRHDNRPEQMPHGGGRGTGGRRGILLRGAFVLLILYGPYLIWKQLYFGSLVPNTFYAKTAPPGLMLSNGAAYLGAFVASYGYLAALGMLLMKRLFPRGGTAGTALPFVLAHWAAMLILGGDWMPQFRLLLPTLPLVLLFANEGLVAAVS
ncbi:MAG TPA: hypothetical protein ENO08_02860, partial [Candidatus Eisenbacteria bacterium]|nr:hypothetical protein [Candidatus Eisenbacteria bacterium]